MSDRLFNILKAETLKFQSGARLRCDGVEHPSTALFTDAFVETNRMAFAVGYHAGMVTMLNEIVMHGRDQLELVNELSELGKKVLTWFKEIESVQDR